MKNRLPGALALLLLVSTAGIAAAADPVVLNVMSEQRTDGSGIVTVTYDLADADGDSCHVSLQASDDLGLTWDLACSALAGDIGPGVTPGLQRTISWDVGAEHPGLFRDDLRVRVLASDLALTHAAHSPHNYAIHAWDWPDWSDPRMIEHVSRADVLVVDAPYLWDGGPNQALDVVGRIKAINPDCLVIGYVSAHVVGIGWGSAPLGSYSRTMWDAMLPFWAYTTVGDTLQSWPGKINTNISNPLCREQVVAIISDYQRNSGTAFDGVFWDYYNSQVWIPDFVDCEGDPDLDGDGISMYADPGETAEFKAACVDQVNRLRLELGEDFIQIFNGQRAYTDSAFAALADGIVYELFPTLGFQAPDKMRNAMDPAVFNSLWHSRRWLRTQNGGPYVMLWNAVRLQYYDDQQQLTELHPGNMFRAISLLIDGCYPVWDFPNDYFRDWPEVPVSLGEPLGPTVINGDVFTRNYEFGDVRLAMGSGIWPNPFTYRIRVNGRIVEEFAMPFHFP